MIPYNLSCDSRIDTNLCLALKTNIYFESRFWCQNIEKKRGQGINKEETKFVAVNIRLFRGRSFTVCTLQEKAAWSFIYLN